MPTSSPVTQQPPNRVSISVCICTFKRPFLLESLLEKLAGQETDGLFDFSIIVVDNDAEGSARRVVEKARDGIHPGLIYEIEPERSIPAARNHAVRLAEGDYLAMIDDDEFPPSRWLVTLYKALRDFGADGVLGPVLAHFEQPPPPWIVKGRFFERPAILTGTILDWHQTRTGNVLIRKAVFGKNRLMFDLKWRTSGEDIAFFRQAMSEGYKFIAVKEAPVYEIVPPERWTKQYQVRRSFIQGFNSARNISTGYGSLRRLFFALRSAATAACYFAALPFSFFAGQHMVMKCLEKGSYHLSRLAAMVGIEFMRDRNL